MALARRALLWSGIILATLGILLLIWSVLGPPVSAGPPVEDISVQASLDDASDLGLEDQPAAPESLRASNATAVPNLVIVYVSGAVRAPDVYQLPATARIKDLLLAAGGLAEDADQDRINLAERLVDGQHVYVPRLGEEPPASGAPDESPADPQENRLININTASAAELDGLDGIGQALAQRIVEYRTANGPFAAVEDLRNVKGIGPALFDKIAPYITVGP